MSTLQEMLQQIAQIDGATNGAHNIRHNGASVSRQDSKNVKILPKADGSGMDIHIAPNTAHEIVHIPVVIDHTGLVETVYNEFYIGDDADVTIVAGCGIHNDGDAAARHDGVHTFHVGKRAHIQYLENHLGGGNGAGDIVLNPVTHVHLDEDSTMEMDTVQIEGVDSTRRETYATLGDRSCLIVKEKLMTTHHQLAETVYEVHLNGEDCSSTLSSRSVAKDNSRQVFLSKIFGNNACNGHSECDAIIMDAGSVSAIPEVTANHVDASLIHEAAIGKIAGEQIIKLMTLGLSEEAAEQEIIHGFLR